MRNDFQSNYLMHHGILGQKWGVRRYQNPDGSLTTTGRERYGVKEGGSVSDISTAKGYNRRVKDLKKAIKKNEKKRGKEHTKIANNPENFLGANKKHAKKIEEYSENIRRGEEEIKKLFAKAESEGYTTRFGKIKDKEESKYKNPDGTLTKKATKELLKSARNDAHKEDIQKFSKMTSAELDKERKARAKATDDAMKASLAKGGTKGEKIAKEELAEQTFNDLAKIIAYQKSVENLLDEKKKNK